MHKPLIAGGVALTGLVLLALAFIIWTPGTRSGMLSGQELQVPQSTLTPMPAQSPASIPVEPVTGKTTTPATGALAITGPVTEVSIQNYVAANPSVGGMNAKNVKVASVRFINVRELRDVLRAELKEEQPYLDDFSPDEPVAYVILSGDFYVETDPAETDLSKATSLYHSTFRVFSVRTGNELMGGTIPSSKEK